MTLLPGYDDDGLAREVPELLDLPGFWPAFLGGRLDEPMDQVAAMFGVDEGDVESAYAGLTDPTAWPVFVFDTGRGARLAVVQRNFEEDEGVDYLLLPDGGTAITFAVDEGARAGRGISWAELSGLAGRQPTPRRGAVVLLLLVPILNSPGVRAELTTALRTAGVTGDVEQIAERLLVALEEDLPSDDEPGPGDGLVDRLLS